MQTMYEIEGFRAAPRWRARLYWFFAGLCWGWLIAQAVAALRALA